MSLATIGIEQIKALAAFDTPTIANAIEVLEIPHTQFTEPAIRAVVPFERRIVGIAATATMKEQWGTRFAHIEPWLRYLEEIERTPVPVIAVFHDESAVPGREAMVGEGMSRVMRACGTIGVICDGAMRDIAALRQMSFPAMAGGLSADRGRIRFHRYQIPVQVCGMLVHPGDLIHADENGAIIVPADRLADVLQAAANVSDKEARLFEMFERPTFRVAQLTDHYAEALATARAEKALDGARFDGH